ncbi:MAG: acyltransferase family protein [Bryobacteraceae bacterium]
MSGRAEKQDEFPALTGIRAIAAYLVFFFHFAPSPNLVGERVYHFAAEGHVGVTVFYVLSGFLIAWNYFDRSGSDSGFWRPYVVKRIARIQPVYLMLLAAHYAAAFAGFAGLPSGAMEVFLNATLLKGFVEAVAFTGIGQAWSLTVEETFYLSAPFLFRGIRRWGLIWTQSAIWALGALLLAAGVFDTARFTIGNTFFGRSFEFIAGIACALWLKKSSPAPRGFALLTWAGVAGFAAAQSWMASLATPADYGVGHPVGKVLNNLVLPPFLAMLFLGLIREQSIIRTILSSRVFVLLGRSSYAFYLVHVGPIHGVLAERMAGWSEGPRLAVGFAAMNAIAVLIYWAYERPANAWVREVGMGRWLSPRRVVVAAVALAGLWTVALVQGREHRGSGHTVEQTLRLPGAEALEKPVASRTAFGSITSHIAGPSPLLEKVGGESLRGHTYLFAHAASSLRYALEPGRWKKLSFSMGLDDAGGNDAGSVVYLVIGDGRELFRSDVVRAMQPPRNAVVSIEGVRDLELRITDAGDGIAYDEAYWIDLRLE